MNLETYLKEIKRTTNSNLTFKENILNYSLGVSGEIAELIENIQEKIEESNLFIHVTWTLKNSMDIKKEFGDCFWYLFNLYKLFEEVDINFKEECMKIETNQTVIFEKETLNVMIKTGKLLDHIKKFVYHGEYIGDLVNKIRELIILVYRLVVFSGNHIEEIFEINISKLKKRYPSGFSIEDSKNRKE